MQASGVTDWRMKKKKKRSTENKEERTYRSNNLIILPILQNKNAKLAKWQTETATDTSCCIASHVIVLAFNLWGGVCVFWLH